MCRFYLGSKTCEVNAASFFGYEENLNSRIEQEYTRHDDRIESRHYDQGHSYTTTTQSNSEPLGRRGGVAVTILPGFNKK